jgi:L-ascorbate metabolism protein UlaG (beta-lactamase superfamily)
VKSKLVVPHHYATFPVLTQNADGFTAALKKKGIAYKVMEPGSSIVFEGKKLK